MKGRESLTSRLVLRVLLLTPWVFILWLFLHAIDDSFNGLLVFVIIAILIPLTVLLNVVTYVIVKGRSVIQQLRGLQNRRSAQSAPLESPNYAEQPWWRVGQLLRRLFRSIT